MEGFGGRGIKKTVKRLVDMDNSVDIIERSRI